MGGRSGRILAIRPHVHLGVLIVAALLVVGILGAVLAPRWMQTRSPAVENAGSDRSDRKAWNDDASLPSFDVSRP
jgi:hypothetical protein